MKRTLSMMAGMVLAGVVAVQAEGTVTAGGTVSNAAVSAKPVKMQTHCPVMMGKIDRKLYVDFEGKRIYACCAGCLATLRKDAAKIVKKMEADGITLEKTPAPPPAPGATP